MAGLCEGGNEPPGSLKASGGYQSGEDGQRQETRSYNISLYTSGDQNPSCSDYMRQTAYEVTCPDWESNPGHLVSRRTALTVTPQVWIEEEKEEKKKKKKK
ncbi:hypothetical protein ANN_23554 [Periplaneta americana]|uniref:Uncharacterized protein n=1 Tax=Periplaneta americana TaxID=6978 RepID=A0ABQ8SLG2_PERAM|nr:hypothetical protein ANN_23554 [Periplaneta americana]